MKNEVSFLTTTINAAVLVIIVSIIAALFIQKTDYIEAKGKLQVNKYYNIYSTTNGKVLKVLKDFGDKIDKDEEILILDRKEIETLVGEDKIKLSDISMKIREKTVELNNINIEKEELKNEGKIKEVEISTLKEELLRIKYMFEKGEKPKYELNKIEQEIKIKEIEMEKIRNIEYLKIKEEIFLRDIQDLKEQQRYYLRKIENEELEMNKNIVKSDKDNLTIITMNLKELEGTVVKKGDLLVSMVDTRQLKMVVRVKESDIGKIRIGQATKIFLDAIPYEKFSVVEGSVSKIYPQTKGDEETYNIIELQIIGFESTIKKNGIIDTKLKDGLKGTARIIISNNRSILSFLYDKFW